jgi:hypothetical protein
MLERRFVEEQNGCLLELNFRAKLGKEKKKSWKAGGSSRNSKTEEKKLCAFDNLLLEHRYGYIASLGYREKLFMRGSALCSVTTFNPYRHQAEEKYATGKEGESISLFPRRSIYMHAKT